MPESRAPWSTGSAHAAGTCGEFAQGVLAGGRRFHVTCPIDRGVTLQLRVRPARCTTVRGLAPHAWKAARALGLAAELMELGPIEIDVVHHRSTLEEAKGMASSTADVVAAVRALATASGQSIAPDAIAELAASIEPTDAIMHDGVVVADHHTGERLRRWPWTPRYAIAMFVPTARHRTTAALHPGQAAHLADYASLLGALDEAAQTHDDAAFAAAATRSATLNDAFVPNALFRAIRRLAPETGALGLCVGHSGTVCGALFPAGADGTQLAREAIERLLPHLGSGTSAGVVQMPVARPTAPTRQAVGPSATDYRRAASLHA